MINTLTRTAEHPRVATASRSVPDSHRALLTFGALTFWLALVAISVAWGEHVVAVGDRLGVGAPPLTGNYEWRVGIDAVPAVLLAAIVVVMGPRLAREASWARLLALVAVASIAWATVLALVDGWGALTDPLLPNHYLGTVPRVGDPVTFLMHFTHRIATFNIDTQGHPPGMVLLLWLLDRVGLGGVGWNAVLVLAGGGAAVVAALVTLREVAGEDRARAAAPFFVVVPGAIWWSSGDALFSGVAAWAVALVVLATGRSGPRSDRLALFGGFLFAVTAFLSYGLVLLAVVPAVVAVARRRGRPVVLAVLGALPVFFGFLAAGFMWFAGLEATRARYFAGVASRRPYDYFVVGNVGAFALALGPAVAVAVAWLRDKKVWLLVGGGLAAVALADLSGMSKAEVERIWLPFVPWVLVATAAFGSTRRRSGVLRPWLVLQAASWLLVEVAVRSRW